MATGPIFPVTIKFTNGIRQKFIALKPPIVLDKVFLCIRTAEDKEYYFNSNTVEYFTAERYDNYDPDIPLPLL